MWSTDRSLSPRANNFGVVRLLLAVSVLFSHCFPLVDGDNAREPLARLTSGSLTIGSVAVNAFLVISGFLVAHSWARRSSVRDFLTRRVRRIYPGFVVVMLVQAFIVAPLFCAESNPSYSLGQLALLGFNIVDLVQYGYPYGGLLDVFPNNPLPHEMNGSLWTIRYEFVCYLLLVALALAGALSKRACAPVIVGVAALLEVFDVRLPAHPIATALFGASEHLPRFVGFFFAGVTFYTHREKIPYSPAIAVGSALSLTMLRLVPQLGFPIQALAGTYLLFWIVFRPSVPLAALAERADLSYGVYLYAFPIQQIAVAVSAGRLGVATLFAIATPVTLLLAALSWFLVERRFLSSSRRAGQRREA